MGLLLFSDCLTIEVTNGAACNRCNHRELHVQGPHLCNTVVHTISQRPLLACQARQCCTRTYVHMYTYTCTLPPAPAYLQEHCTTRPLARQWRTGPICRPAGLWGSRWSNQLAGTHIACGRVTPHARTCTCICTRHRKPILQNPLMSQTHARRAPTPKRITSQL